MVGEFCCGVLVNFGTERFKFAWVSMFGPANSYRATRKIVFVAAEHALSWWGQ